MSFSAWTMRQLFHALGQRLNDKIVAVAIDDEDGNIRFTVDDPKCGRVDLQRRSKSSPLPGDGGTGHVGWRVSVCQYPDHLRSIAVQSRTEKLAAAISNRNNVSRSAVASTTSER
jgi:hypothetical protein